LSFFPTTTQITENIGTNRRVGETVVRERRGRENEQVQHLGEGVGLYQGVAEEECVDGGGGSQ
jgi:hypothetical protein